MNGTELRCRSGESITGRLWMSLQRKNIKLGFDWRDELDVEWAGHPNWYFRISKFSIPYLRHPSVPKTWFLDRLESIPDDLQNYALKPLYSFAGLGVVIAPRKEDIEAIPAEKRAEYILQERLHFEPIIETPFGATKAEVRVMYIWPERLDAGADDYPHGSWLDDGVDHNKNMAWVGASAGLCRKSSRSADSLTTVVWSSRPLGRRRNSFSPERRMGMGSPGFHSPGM